MQPDRDEQRPQHLRPGDRIRLRVALAAAGVRTTAHRVPNPAEPDRLATLELRPGTVTETDLEMAAATTLGLATCPLSQPLEVGSTRRTLRDDVLDGTLSPQLVLRLGWAPAVGQRGVPQDIADPSGEVTTGELGDELPEVRRDRAGGPLPGAEVETALAAR